MGSHLYSLTALKLLTDLKFAIYIMMLQDSIVDDVSVMSTLNTATSINSLKICYLHYDVSRSCCGGREYI